MERRTKIAKVTKVDVQINAPDRPGIPPNLNFTAARRPGVRLDMQDGRHSLYLTDNEAARAAVVPGADVLWVSEGDDDDGLTLLVEIGGAVVIRQTSEQAHREAYVAGLGFGGIGA